MKDNFNENLHKEAKRKLYQYAREMRKNATEAEKILWSKLKARRFLGLKFRRQHPLDTYVADFYCHEIKLVIEVDGEIHEEEINVGYDFARTLDLNELEIDVIRFSNYQIMSDINSALQQLSHYILSKNQ